jgi:hypothetical protein
MNNNIKSNVLLSINNDHHLLHQLVIHDKIKKKDLLNIYYYLE